MLSVNSSCARLRSSGRPRPSFQVLLFDDVTWLWMPCGNFKLICASISSIPGISVWDYPVSGGKLAELAHNCIIYLSADFICYNSIDIGQACFSLCQLKICQFYLQLWA